MKKFVKSGLTLVLSVCTSLVVSNAVLAHGPRIYQAPPQVTIYADANFQGASQTLREGWYDIGQLRIGNDTLSSVKVPDGWRVTLYADAKYRGRTKTLRSDNSFVADFNDLTSSIRVEKGRFAEPERPRFEPAVTIYADANYQGSSQTLKEGWYNINQLTIGNDILSSVKVPDGWRVTLYEDADYRGRSKTLRSDNSFVADFNDLTSSIRVERGGFAEPERPRFEPQVTIYADANYQGASQTLKEGWYNINQLTIGNDILSSVKVPEGWRVTLYADADYRGSIKTLRSDNAFVADFNDLTSSIRVEYVGRRR